MERIYILGTVMKDSYLWKIYPMEITEQQTGEGGVTEFQWYFLNTAIKVLFIRKIPGKRSKNTNLET